MKKFIKSRLGTKDFGTEPQPPPSTTICIPLPLDPPPPGLNKWRKVDIKEVITFKSPTNMKKVIQSRIETTNNMSNNFGPVPLPPPNIFRPEQLNDYFQPPLPLDPPPPDNAVFNVQVKEEIEDPEYTQISQNAHARHEGESENGYEPVVGTPRQEIIEDKRPICRDFNRGLCHMRPGSCRYAHRYEFCRQYQNLVCTYVKCKYVHASIFEEQEYYRSGYLPPHVFSHMVEIVPPPPPPPMVPPVLYNIHLSKLPPPPPPPPLPNFMDKPIMHCIPGTSRDSRIFVDNIGPIASSSSSSLKRAWSEMQQFPAPPCDLVYNEQLPKKCRHCDIMEYRLQFNKNKIDQMINSKEELKKKTAMLEMKSDKLYSVILSLLKPTFMAQMQEYANAVNGDKEITLWDQLTNFFNMNRMPAFGQEQP